MLPNLEELDDLMNVPIDPDALVPAEAQASSRALFSFDLGLQVDVVSGQDPRDERRAAARGKQARVTRRITRSL